ncbi:flagellar basal body rod C-terminal domain-containing protein [Pseudoalteromonas sp.]|uniref:flagellar basal body rod C-terminal domain-containing protein n=1 Tax=Pseudoalteromonas sp. TaxID=53249 RepID=UPI003562692B
MDVSNNLGSAYNAGLQGLQSASDGITEASANIARAQTERENVERQEPPQETREAQSPPVNVTEELVNLRVEQFNAQANTRSIQTADEVLGTLIDVRV